MSHSWIAIRPSGRNESIIVSKYVGSYLGLLLLATIAGLVISKLSPSFTVILLVFMGMVLALPIIVRAMQKRFDPFEPIVAFSLAYGILFLLRPIAVYLAGNYLVERPTRIIDVQDTFDLMLVIALIGAISFFAGYAIPWGSHLAKTLPKPHDNFPTSAIAVAATLIGGLGLLALILFLAMSGGTAALKLMLAGRSYQTIQNGISGGYFSQAQGLLVPGALVMIAIGRIRRNTMVFLIGLIFGGVVLLRTLPLGSRAMLLPLVIGLGVFWYMQRTVRPGPFTLIVLLVGFLATSSLVLAYRDQQARQTSSPTQVVTATFSDLGTLFYPLIGGEDASACLYMAAALQLIPEEVPHTYGRAILGDLVIRPLPRQLWANKPRAPREQLIEHMFPIEWQARIANPEYSLLPFFYLDFGIPGVAIAMATWGLCFRILFEYYRTYSDSIFAQLLLAVVLGMLPAFVRNSTIDFLVAMGVMVLPIWLIFKFAWVSSRQIRLE